MEIDRATFEEAKSAQGDGVSSKDCAKEMGLEIEVINQIYSMSSWSQFSGESKSEKVLPATAGYYKSIVAKKAEENSTLKEERNWLLEQVYYLRKTTAFLRKRERELQDTISTLEKDILNGITAMEQLDSNKNFTQISGEVKRRTK